MAPSFRSPLNLDFSDGDTKRGSRSNKYATGYQQTDLVRSRSSAFRRRLPLRPPRPTDRSSGSSRRGSILIAGLAATVIVGYLMVSVFGAASRIFTTNEQSSAPFLKFLGRVRPGLLRGEGDGRINILLLGRGGEKHPGGNLTDTIEVVSINPLDKEVGLLAIPRDLLVPIPGYGRDKINAAYALAERDRRGAGPTAAKLTVEELLDIPIHYYVTIDFNGFKEFVDAVGGVTIKVEKDLYDPLYPDAKLVGFEPFSIKAGVHHLDGKTALKYARSRETTSDFDRARRQQQIMVAVKDRMLSLGVLANPLKLQKILSAAEANIRTDVSAVEIERLLELSKEYASSRVIQVVIDNGPAGLLLNQNDERGYYLVPRTGDFEEIRTVAHDLFKDPYLARERARISVENQSGKPTYLGLVTRELTSLGYQIVSAKESKETSSKTNIIDFTDGGKPFTLTFLAKRLKATTTTLTGSSGVDLQIKIGEDYTPDKVKDDTPLKKKLFESS